MNDLMVWFLCTTCAVCSCYFSDLTFKNYLEASLITGDKQEERRCRVELAVVRAVFVAVIISCLWWLLEVV